MVIFYIYPFKFARSANVFFFFFYKKLKLKNAVLYGNEYRNKQLLNRVNLSFPF